MRAARQSAISSPENRFWPGLNDRPYPGSDGATIATASEASPPKRAGSVRRGISWRNSNTEPGQPWESSSGSGSGPRPCTCRKCTSMPDSGTENCGNAFRRASALRQSKSLPPIRPQLLEPGDLGPVGPRRARRLVREPRAGKTGAQILDRRLRHGKREWFRGFRHVLGLQGHDCCQISARRRD